jgi:hypothetical protein
MIRKTLLILASVIFGCTVSSWVFAGTSGTYNSQGVSGAPLSVGTTATLVVPFKAGRTDAYIFNVGTVVMYCTTGPTGGGAPSPDATSAGANATPVQANGFVHYSLNGAYTPTGVGLVSQAEVDCACSTGTCQVNTWELP